MTRTAEPDNQSGEAAVEFALILPVLLLLVFGIINFGVYLYDKAVITNASREGARAGIVVAVSGNGFSRSDGACSQVFNRATNLMELSQSTAQCVAEQYIGSHLVSFISSTPTVASSVSGVCANPVNVGANSCKLTVTVNYPYGGIGWFQTVLPTLTATTTMYY